MIELVMYTTLGCHLCTQLERQLRAIANQPVELKPVEICDDTQLLARYGERIPVLADGQGEELERGMEIDRLAAWLATRGWLDQQALAAVTSPLTTSSGATGRGAVLRDGRRYLG